MSLKACEKQYKILLKQFKAINKVKMKIIIFFAFAVTHLHGQGSPWWCNAAKQYCTENSKDDCCKDYWPHEFDACKAYNRGNNSFLCDYNMGKIQPWYCYAAQQKCVSNNDNVNSGKWLIENNYWTTSMQACRICYLQCRDTNCNKPWWCEACTRSQQFGC